MTLVGPADAARATCPYCGRPFPEGRILTLHKGSSHAEELSETEWAAVREAREQETEDLRTFKLLALAALVVLYFGFLITYAILA